MAKQRRSIIICPRCGGRTYDIHKHVNGPTRACETRRDEMRSARTEKEHREHGWRHVDSGATALMLIRMGFEYRHPSFINAFGVQRASPYFFRAWVAHALQDCERLSRGTRKRLLDLLMRNEEAWFAYHSEDFKELRAAAHRLGGYAAVGEIVREFVCADHSEGAGCGVWA